MDLAAVSVIAAALIAGLLGSRFLRARYASDQDAGPGTSEVIGQALTLTVLFLAFVLVESSGSYGRARAAVSSEAETLDNMSETAGYAPEPRRREMLATTACYARAVVSHEWPAMANGHRSPIADVWTERLLVPFEQLYDADELVLFERLVVADGERSVARDRRLAEAVPTTPLVVYWLVVLTLAISLAGFAFSLPRRRNTAHVAMLLVVAVLLLVTVVLIRDLDLPFSGFARLTPAAMTEARDDLTAGFQIAYPGQPLPCDDTGRPTR
ncbi:MAG: DUF4239 domain-containing protein [Sporichthyaceae bacterium]|nr:DUF4239 domain-containing protein [Sporichthyaceae bacterium]